MTNNIILCGVGGQGTVLASKLLANAAMEKNIPVKTAETIGMAQRGGSVFSHVRLGEGAASPLIGKGKADLIIGFEPAEAVRQLPYLRKGGTMVVSSSPIIPASAYTGGPAYDVDAILSYLSATVEQLIMVDAQQASADLGSSKCLNVVLLGAAVRSGALMLTQSDISRAIKRLVPERFQELNSRALAYTKH